jgi:hypothetical protein
MQREIRLKIYKKLIQECEVIFNEMKNLSSLRRDEAKRYHTLNKSWNAKLTLKSKILAKI